jgi:hypothetical protein
MAYGLKYELLCTTQKSNLYKARVYFDDYTDADIDRNIPVNPFVLRKDRSAVIRGTSFDFSMREEIDFEFLDFYTNKPKYIFVELLDSSDVQLWSGFLDTQQYSCPYVPSPLTVSFTASDGLGLLKNEAFTLTGTQTQFAIIMHCIEKIGLGTVSGFGMLAFHGYAVAIGVHELRHNASRSPLEQTIEDCDTFIDLNCYEAIEKILNKYDAEIYHWKGRWRIISSNDKKSTRLLYDSQGTYTGTEAAPAVLDLGYPGSGIEVTPVGQLSMSLEPGGKQVHAVHSYGRKDSLLINYEFKDFDAGAFDSWIQSGTFAVTQGDLNGLKFAFLETTSIVNGDGISQSIAYNNSGGEGFLFEIDYCSVGYLQGTYKRIIAMTVRFQVYLTDGQGGNYWLNELEDGYGEWTTTPTIISKLHNASREWPEFNHIRIETEPPPISGYISVDLYRHYGSEPGPNYHYLGVCWSKPIVNLIGGEAAEASTRYEATAVFDNSTELIKLPDISILNADAPADVYNKAILYKNITFLEADGEPTWLWNIDGVTGDYSTVEVLFKLLASRNRVSRQVLQGTIKGTSIALDSIIKHAYNSNREFEIAECSWYIYEEKVNGKFLEILAWSDEDITITIGEKVPASNTSSSGGSAGGTIVQMTPAEILAALITVDGAGSNLDADTLDGRHASAFALSDHYHAGVYEPYLGLPDDDDYILSSKADGTRSWIEAPAVADEYIFRHSLIESGGFVNLKGDVATPGVDQFYSTWGDTERGWHDIPYHYLQYSVTEDEEGYINLVGDVESPGNSKFYGTNNSGERGWYSMAEGDSLPDVHNEVIGSTDIVCTVAEADMDNMTITYTPEGNHALVLFSAPFTLASPGWENVILSINIGGVDVKSTMERMYDGSSVVAFHHLASVTPGNSLTIKIRWSGSDSIMQAGDSIGVRTLTVIDLP